MHDIERRIFRWSRFLTVVAVVGSLAGSLLMFCLGLVNIFDAFHLWLPGATDEAEREPREATSVISVIEGLDRFLIGIVLLYFAYGVYSLFVRPGEPERELSLPDWLRVKQIGQLKQVVAEVILVILFVLFLRVALRAFQDPVVTLDWLEIGTFLALPLSTLLLALALRLVELHPKPPRYRRRKRARGDDREELVEDKED